jgi:hypothetical protein
MKFVALILVACVVVVFGIVALSGDNSDPMATINRQAASLSAPNSAKALTSTLRKRGSHVKQLTCVDASAKRQRCTGVVDGRTHTWRVDIDLATATRDFVVTS